MIDLHCHILPGLDDGPTSPSESLALARELFELGFSQACATPHLPWGTKTASADELARCRKELAAVLSSNDVGLELMPGAEHHSTMVADLAKEGRLVCYPRGDTFLLEFPLGGFPARWQDLVFFLQVRGKIPVIAHVERIPEVREGLSALELLKERGCLLLVNLSSLAGAMGKDQLLAVRTILKAGLADAATSDMHSASESPALAEGLRMLKDLVGEEQAHRLLCAGPATIAGIPVPSTGSSR